MNKLYGAALSPMVRKVLMSLEIKGLDFEHEVVIPGMTPEGYEKVSPLKKIPAFVDESVSLADSSVICEYLEDRYPETPLYPSDPASKAQARWLEEYSDTVLLEVLGGNLFFERVVKPLMGMETDEEKVQKSLKEKVPAVLDYVESVLPEEGFLLGDQLMMADIAIGSHLINAGYAGFEPDAEAYPKLSAYMEKIRGNSAFQLRIEADSKFIGQ